jgi:hypothetical protein
VKTARIAHGLPPIPRAEYLLGLFRIGAWIAEYGRKARVFAERPDLYRWVAQELLAGGPVTYLEFGVFNGNSIRFWSQTNRHPDSRFHGFDTFEGLPEDWQFFTGTAQKGAYSAGGKIPQIDDSRVSFYKGLFQDTLPGFLAATSLSGQLVLHMDADLFTSTAYVLARMHPHLAPGTILIFDEFTGPLDEYRAWTDYVRSHMRRYEVLAQRHNYEQIVVRVTA